jgi:hypothetical protein
MQTFSIVLLAIGIAAAILGWSLLLANRYRNTLFLSLSLVILVLAFAVAFAAFGLEFAPSFIVGLILLSGPLLWPPFPSPLSPSAIRKLTTIATIETAAWIVVAAAAFDPYLRPHFGWGTPSPTIVTIPISLFWNTVIQLAFHLPMLARASRLWARIIFDPRRIHDRLAAP